MNFLPPTLLEKDYIQIFLHPFLRVFYLVLVFDLKQLEKTLMMNDEVYKSLRNYLYSFQYPSNPFQVEIYKLIQNLSKKNKTHLQKIKLN